MGVNITTVAPLLIGLGKTGVGWIRTEAEFPVVCRKHDMTMSMTNFSEQEE